MSAELHNSPTRTEQDAIHVTCPADRSPAGQVPVDGTAAVERLASQLRVAQTEWESMGPTKRASWLDQWRDWIIDNDRRLLEIVQSESGKSWGDANIETLAAVESLKYWASHAKRFSRPDRPRPAGLMNSMKRLEVEYRPYPLVGVITPWNYPLGMPMLDIPAALAAGCAVLSKPSEVVPLAWREAVRGFVEDVGAPRVLGCATGYGETGEAVVDAVDMVQFTGSTATGKRVAERAGGRLIPCSVELGGKDAMIVLRDADLSRAVDGAIWGGLFNAGQSCVSVERVYVEEAVYDKFVSTLCHRISSLRLGMDAPGAYAKDFGAMANDSQVAIVQRHIKDALDNGARAAVGGGPPQDGTCLQGPTVLVDVDHTMACMQEETFGPILPVMKIHDVDEAVRLANDSPYGLSASVWTKDARAARSTAANLEVGGVNVNNVMMHVFQFPLPMGGWKASGVGTRYGGKDGIRKYCRSRALVQERVNMKYDPHWYPYRPAFSRIVGKVTRFLGARDLRRRLGR